MALLSESEKTAARNAITNVAKCFACAIDPNDEKFALNPLLMDALRVLRGEKQADLDLTQELVNASVN